MSKNELTPKYILVDFNCAHEYTHHWSSMVAYANLIKNNGILLECWVPIYASKGITKKLSEFGLVKQILRSPQYGAKQFQVAPYSYLLARMVNLGFRRSEKFKNRTRELLVFIYVRKVIRELKKETVINNVVLVFPTLDYLGLQVVKVLLKDNCEIDIRIRRMGSEARSPFSTGNEFSELISLVDCIGNERIRLGIPTTKLLGKTKKGIKFPERIYWSPLPPEIKSRVHVKSQIGSSIAIGFPGAAKESKGFSSLVDIAEELNKEEIEYTMYIQGATFPWESYEIIRARLRKICRKLVELNSVLSIQDYERFMDIYDVIYLPYDAKYYADADSGILYQAADRRIPVICEDGLGFSGEAFNFGIAVNPKKFTSLKEMIGIALSTEVQTNIERYNKVREGAIRDFLSIETNG